jgi:thioredoxin reductase
MNHDVLIIGAGPYGLSIASHLGSSNRISVVGKPMNTWTHQMPAGMRLKSEGFASSLYDPGRQFRLANYCQERGIPYADTGLPVAVETFSDYGEEFARRYVPSLQDRNVVALRAAKGGFEAELDDGAVQSARAVVCAVGITHYAETAPVLATLPAHLVSHSSKHRDLSVFAGKTVAVVGGGASAADCAALLSQFGATTHLLARRAHLVFHEPPAPRRMRTKIRRPLTTIGQGWKGKFYTDAPLMFHAAPEKYRHKVVASFAGPAPCWFVRQQIEEHVTVRLGVQITAAAEQDGRAVLSFIEDGQPRTLAVDHVIAATGYKADIGRLSFLDTTMRRQIRTAGTTPVLSRSFESTVPGLFFVGAASANCFGPMLRFACGAEFAAKRLAKKLN